MCFTKQLTCSRTVMEAIFVKDKSCFGFFFGILVLEIYKKKLDTWLSHSDMRTEVAPHVVQQSNSTFLSAYPSDMLAVQVYEVIAPFADLSSLYECLNVWKTHIKLSEGSGSLLSSGSWQRNNVACGKNTSFPK